MFQMGATSFRRYFEDPFNRFDFVVVCISIVEVVLEKVLLSESPGMLTECSMNVP
jgi:hypothetical protein